jgi:hypothetical protein
LGIDVVRTASDHGEASALRILRDTPRSGRYEHKLAR